MKSETRSITLSRKTARKEQKWKIRLLCFPSPLFPHVSLPFRHSIQFNHDMKTYRHECYLKKLTFLLFSTRFVHLSLDSLYSLFPLHPSNHAANLIKGTKVLVITTLLIMSHSFIHFHNRQTQYNNWTPAYWTFLVLTPLFLFNFQLYIHKFFLFDLQNR